MGAMPKWIRCSDGPPTVARRERLAVGLVIAAVSMALAVVASASTDAAPPSPSLAAMALAPADLAPGAKIVRQGYVKDADFASYYEREFGSGASFHSARFLSLEADIGLAKTTADASLFVDGLVIALQSKKGRDLVVKAALGELSKKDKANMKLSFGRVRRVDVGSDAVIAPMAITVLGLVRVPFTIAAVRVDRAAELLSVAGGPGTSLSMRDMTALLGVAAKRMASGFTPANLAPPTIGGAAQSGATLTGTSGSWSNAPTSYAYTWLRCDATGAGCQAIVGATSASYVVTDADVGSTFRLAVTATKGATTSPATQSAPTAVVVAAAPSPTTAALRLPT